MVESEIGEFVASVVKRLKAGKRVTPSEVGRFTLDKSDSEVLDIVLGVSAAIRRERLVDVNSQRLLRNLEKAVAPPRERKRFTEKERKAKIASYNASEKAKAAIARYTLSGKRKATAARYNASEEGKAVRARYLSSEEGKAVQARYSLSEKSKATRARYSSSEKGKAALARGADSGLGRVFLGLASVYDGLLNEGVSPPEAKRLALKLVKLHKGAGHLKVGPRELAFGFLEKPHGRRFARDKKK